MIALSRKPSIWANFFGRLAFGVVWAGGFFAFTWFIWTRRNVGHTPIFVWFAIGFFDLIAIGVVWDIVVRFWRALNGRVPVVEIDRKSLRYGDTAQLHVIETETPPADDAKWRIVVTTELRQGGLIQHPFPISIEKRAE